MEQVVQLETRFNAIPLPTTPQSAADVSEVDGHEEGADGQDGVDEKANLRPLARRVKVSLQPFPKLFST